MQNVKDTTAAFSGRAAAAGRFLSAFAPLLIARRGFTAETTTMGRPHLTIFERLSGAPICLKPLLGFITQALPLLAVMTAAPAHATIFSPDYISGKDSEYSTTLGAENTIDGSGLPANFGLYDTHTGYASTTWAPLPSGSTGWIEGWIEWGFNSGQSIRQVHIWNNENRSAKNITLTFYGLPGPIGSINHTLTDVDSSTGNYTLAETIDLGTTYNNVFFVRADINTGYGEGLVGFGEVAFSSTYLRPTTAGSAGTPPNTAPLADAGTPDPLVLSAGNGAGFALNGSVSDADGAGDIESIAWTSDAVAGTLATTAAPTGLDVADIGLADTQDSVTLTLAVADGNTSHSDTLTVSYQNSPATIDSFASETKGDGSVELSATLSDLDLALNDTVSGFETLSWSLTAVDSGALLMADTFGGSDTSFDIGVTLDPALLAQAFDGAGLHDVILEIEDLAVANAANNLAAVSQTLQITVPSVPAPAGALLLLPGLIWLATRR